MGKCFNYGLAACLALSGMGALQAAEVDVAGQTLNFGTPALQSGSGTAVGSVYLYTNVITVGSQVVDAVVSIEALNGATISSVNNFDNPTSPINNINLFQPNLVVTTAGQYGDFRVRFIEGGTFGSGGTPITLLNLDINSYDLDGTEGGSPHRQWTDFSGISGYRLKGATVAGTATFLLLEDVPGGSRFITTNGNNNSQAPGTSAGDRFRVRVNFNAISETLIRLGDGGTWTEVAGAEYSLEFGPGPAWFSDANNFPEDFGADLSIEKTVDNDSPAVGASIGFTLTATNNESPDTPLRGLNATSVSVSDQLPDCYTFVSADASAGTYDNETGIWTVGPLARGEVETLEVEVTVDESGECTNTATISSDQDDLDSTNNTDSATTDALDPPTVAKAFSPTSVPFGTSSQLTITLGNSNDSALTLSSLFTDTLPTGMTIASPNGLTKTCPGTVTATAGTAAVLYASGASIPVGGCTISVNVITDNAGALENEIPVGALATNEAASNQAAASATLTVVANPTITKAFSPATITAGGTSTLTLTLGNSNASALTLSSLFSDTLPTGMTIASPNGLTKTCPGTVTATAGTAAVLYASGASIPAGGCTISVNVTSNTPGALVNDIPSAALQTTQGGGNPDPASATLQVNASILANDDAYTFQAAAGGVTGSIFLNDRLNNASFSSGQVALTQLPDSSVTGWTIQPNGTINVPPYAPGVYVLNYRICVIDEQICDEATVTITLTDVIPTLPQWGLILMGLALLGLVTLRRQVRAGMR